MNELEYILRVTKLEKEDILAYKLHEGGILSIVTHEGKKYSLSGYKEKRNDQQNAEDTGKKRGRPRKKHIKGG